MSHEEVDYIDIIRTHGHRVTPQRLIILDAVCEAGPHATFGEIYRRVKEADATIDQSTIYRTLEFLCEVGLVISAEIGETVYEIAGKTPHHHLVCEQCGQVMCLEHSAVRPLFDQIEQQLGFRVQTDHLVFRGLCKKCCPV